MTGRDRAILRRGVGTAPSLVQRPVHFDNFAATRYVFCRKRCNHWTLLFRNRCVACFRFFRFDYRLFFNVPSDSVDLTAAMQTRGAQGDVERRAVGDYMEQFFMELLQRLRNFSDPMHVIPPPKDNDIVHIYLQMSGLDFMFSMDYAGRDRMTLGGLLNPNKLELSKLVENFAAIIQSGKHVILDNQSIIRVWVFRPPAGGGYLRTLDKNYLFEQSKAIKRCPLEAPYCMPGSILLSMDNTRKYRGVNDSKRPRYKQMLLNDAKVLCVAAGVDSNVDAMSLFELDQFGRYLRVNFHFFDITLGDPDCEKKYHSVQIPDASHYYLVLNKGHFHAVSQVNPFLRMLLNNHRMICHDCQQIFCNSQYFDAHIEECPKAYFKTPNLPKARKWHDNVTNIDFDFRSVSGNKDGKPVTELFIQNSKQKDSKIAGILYLDFETYPEEVEKIPLVGNLRPSLSRFTEDGYAEEKSSEPDHVNYEPYPFEPREFSDTYTYLQTVNYCEIQEEDGTAHVFENLKDTFNFLVQPQHEDFVLLAHCGGRFDFQLLYEYYLSSDCIRQGKELKPPLMKGQKIMTATLPYNIRMLVPFLATVYTLLP